MSFGQKFFRARHGRRMSQAKALCHFLLDAEFLKEQSRIVNRKSFYIGNLIVFLIVACVFGGELSDLTKITPGYQTVDEHGVLYKADNNQFIWGVILPRGDTLGLCYFSPTEATASFSSGIALQLLKNELTVTNSAKKVTMRVKPNTIYLLNSDLTIKSSEDLSGIHFVPRKQWSRDANGYVTIYDLEFPTNFYARFGQKDF